MPPFFYFSMLMDQQGLSFHKSERLKKLESFKTLIKVGQSINKFPIRCLWHLIPYDGESVLKVAFNVPKRKFKSAVTRNKIKRRMREAYRLNRKQLKIVLFSNQTTCNILFHYNSSEIANYSKIENSIQQIINTIEAD